MKDQKSNGSELRLETQSIPTLLPKSVTESGSFNALNTTHKSFYTLLNALPIRTMLIDESQSVLFCNEAWAKNSANYEKLIGCRFSSLFDSPEQARDVELLVKSVFEQRSLRIEERRIKIDDSPLWTRMYFRPMRFANDRQCLVLFEDLTLEKKQAVLMNKIRQAKMEWELTVDVVPDLIAMLDTDHRIIRMNKAMADTLGVSYQDAIGKHCYELFHKSGQPPEYCPNARLLAFGEPQRNEVVEERLNAIFEVSVSPLRDDNQRTIGSVHVARDITDRKKAEKLLLEAGRSKAVSELAGVVAHGLSDLTQNFLGGAQLALINLELGNLSDTRENLERILDNSRLAAAALKYLNYLARAHTEASNSVDKVVDLSRAVHEALDLARPWWKLGPERAGVSVAVNRNLGPGCFVSGSENEFFEIVINLVKNAAEALPKGGIISVTTIAREDRVILQVRDEGVGIPEEMLPRIFEPLWTTKGLQGTGMGLARARNIVERHKGTITVESQEGKGTTFTVTLPRTEPQMKQTETPTSEELGPPLNVLVADDSEPLVRMLREALTAAGHRVFSALSGKKAIEMYNAARIDLVVCDSEMPEMNGWQVCRAIKDSCKGKKIPKPPVLLLEGFNRQGTEPDKLAEYGVDAILEKPVEISSLLKAVRGLSGKTVASSDPAELAKQH